MEVKQQQKYRVKLAFDLYSVGQVITPTGLWRDSLLSRGYIEPIQDQTQFPTQPLEQRIKRRAKHGIDSQV